MTKRKVYKNNKVNLFNMGGPTQGTLQGLPQVQPTFMNNINSVKLQGVPSMPQGGGGDIMGGVGSALGGIGSIMSATKANASIADTSGIEANIDVQRNKEVGATTNDSLMAEWEGLTKLKDDYTRKNVRGVSGGQMAVNTVGALGSGVASGASVGGPIGGIIGGVVGLGSAIGGIFSGRRKARRKARRLNKAAKEANSRALFSLQDKAGNIDTQNDLNMLANFSAYGGPLNMGISAIGYDMRNQSLNNQYIKAISTQRMPGVATPLNGVPKLNAFGGTLGTKGGDYSNGVNIIGEGGTHEENPNQGVLLGVDEQGVPNLVEEGEVVFNDYVFSGRIEIPEEMKKKYKFKGKTFARAAELAQKEGAERPFDPISNRGLEDSMNKLQQAQEFIKALEQPQQQMVEQPMDSTVDPTMEQPMEQGTEPTQFAKGGNLKRYAPIFGSAMGAASSIFGRPDYSQAEAIEGVNLNPTLIGSSPIGNYLEYKPLDRDFYINKAKQQTSASKDAILNTSGGNRLNAQAGILALDNNFGNNLGNLARQSEEYNAQQRERVGTFNRSTNMFNTELGLKTDSANASALNAVDRLNLNRTAMAAQSRQAVKDQDFMSRSANLSNLLQGIGDMGAEDEQRSWIDKLARDGVFKIDTKGNFTGTPITRANGGKIKRNKKKGLIYG